MFSNFNSRALLAALLAMGSNARAALGMGGAVRAAPVSNPHRLSAKQTRSRFAGDPGIAGDKLGKRVFHGVVALRNVSGGGYGENVRAKLNSNNVEKSKIAGRTDAHYRKRVAMA